jgi:hypothetical protein
MSLIDKATRRRLERAEQKLLPADPGPEPPEEDVNQWMLWHIRRTPGGLAALLQDVEPLPMLDDRKREAIPTGTPAGSELKEETTARPVEVRPPSPPPAPPSGPKPWWEEKCRWRIRDADDYAEEAKAEAQALRDDDNPLGLYEDDDPFGLYGE